MRKYYITTFGCQMNVSDSERIASMLEAMNFSPSETEAEADVLIYNTCSVRQKSEEKIMGSREKWQKMKENNPNMVIGVTGCMVAHKGYNFQRKLPEVDIAFDIQQLPQLPGQLAKTMGVDLTMPEYSEYLRILPKTKNTFQVSVPIITGCNNFCSYCIVPFTRGREKSRSIKEIVDEITQFIKRGSKEVTLLGQNVNSYRGIKDDGTSANFAYLLHKVAKIPGVQRIFYTSPHPKDMTDDVIDAHMRLPNICPTVHLPVQSGSSTVLQRMNRFYTKESFLDLVEKIYDRIPGVTITTDIIVGFCGETEEDFQDTLDLYYKAQFDLVYIGMYSPRPHSLAYKMKDDVPKEEKERRFRVLHAMQEEVAEAKNKVYLGKKIHVLIDKIKGNVASGRSEHAKYVEISSRGVEVGDIVTVEVNEALTWVLRGEKVF